MAIGGSLTLSVASAAAGPFSVGVDPADPAAGINDPVAGLVVLDRDCGPRQIDVNTAAKGELATALHVAGPAAERIVGGRPWQRSIDLISVPGVGPSKADLLTSRACATPTTLPVSAPLACAAGTSAVDLQSASLADIAAATGLGAPTVERLIAARPLPQDLQQVAAPRVPGFAGPVAADLVAGGKVCVTPAPFTFAGVGWRWASQAGGAVIAAPEDPSFALFVPPGVTSASTGAWGRVTPEPDGDLGTLRGDFHLYDGHWSGQVGVRMPAANLDGSGDTLITHVHGDGSESVSWGAATADGPGYATVAVTSLSEFRSDEFECLPNAGALTAILDCSTSPADEFPSQLAQQRGQAFQAAVAPTVRPGPCNDLGRVHSSGTTPYGLSCGHDGGNGSTATWTLSNDTGASVLEGLFESTGAVYQFDKIANADSLTFVPSAEYGALVGLAKQLFAEKRGLLMSDGSMSITRPAGAPAGVLHLDSAVSEGADAWVAVNAIAMAQDIVDLLGDAAFVVTAADVVRKCIVDVAAIEGLDAIPGCIVDGIDSAASQKWGELEGRTTRARQLKTAIKGGRFVTKWGGVFANAVTSALAGIAANRGAGNLSVWYSRPAPPSGVGGGNGSTNPAGGQDGTIVNDNGDAGNVLFKIDANSRVYFVPPHPGTTAVAHAVLTTSDYYCLAHQYPLRDWLPQSQLLRYALQESAYPETCDQAIETLRYVAGNETNFILRQFAGADGIAHSWFLDGASRLHPIPNGGTYVCLAQKYYVLDGRTDGEIAKFDLESSPATCS
jgi:hypothetical protein